MATKLHLGCGTVHKPGYTNIDRVNPADLIVDLENDVLPYPDEFVDEILAESLLVMIKNIKLVMNECHRVLAKEGKLEVLNFDAGKYPELFFQDPEHRRGLTKDAYYYFDANSNYYKNFGRLYGYKPWIIKSVTEEGKCLRVVMTPDKGGLY